MDLSPLISICDERWAKSGGRSEHDERGGGVDDLAAGGDVDHPVAKLGVALHQGVGVGSHRGDVRGVGQLLDPLRIGCGQGLVDVGGDDDVAAADCWANNE